MASKINGKEHSQLVALAQDILDKTQQVQKHLESIQHPEPSFSAESLDRPNTDEYKSLQSSLRTSLENLQLLVNGPRKQIRSFFAEAYDLGACAVALDFKLFQLVPRGGEISYQKLAQAAGLDEDRVSRIVRMLITRHIFQEAKIGFVSHNPASLLLHDDEEFRATVHYTLDEMWKAATMTSEHLKESPLVSDSANTAFKLRHGLPIFQFYEKNPEYAKRFAAAMAGATRMDRHMNELRAGYPWADISGTVVDCGGGSGHVSMALAREFPHLKWIVQDRPEMHAEGKTILPDDVKDRVSFMPHSFFEANPVKGASVYLIRQCTHNWCDKDVVRMFKGIVPGLEGSKPGTPFLINDIIMPEPGKIPLHEERALRQIDMIMLICFAAKQRTRAEFEQLLKEADPRYVIKRVEGEGEPLGLLEVHLQQD